MKDLLDAVEERRLALGLSQKAVASRLAISQPHYSKVVGSLAALTPEMADAMRQWLKEVPPMAASAGPRAMRIRSLTRSIRQQLRELNSLIEQGGVGRARPLPETGRSKRPADGGSSS